MSDTRRKRLSGKPVAYALTLSLVSLIGCTTPQQQRRPLSGDPLFDDPLGAPGRRAEVVPSRSSADPVLASQPTSPTVPYSTTSTAALANNPPQPVNRDGELRIGSGMSVLPNRQSQAQPQRPYPYYNQPGNANVGGAFEQMRAHLGARGVTWYRLERTDDGRVKFSCSIPNRQNSNISRNHEAVADDDLAAMRAVLEQIDKDR